MEALETLGAISLVPVAVVIVSAIITRRSIEPLLLGGILGYIILSPTNFLSSWINSLTTVAGELGWYYVLFAVSGIIILLLEKSGGTLGFADLLSRFCKTQKSSLIMTWLLGIIIFIDDYLNCLAVGLAMRSLTDKYKVPREFLAYIVNSTGAVVCLLFPVSTWAVYMSAQFEMVDVTVNGTGLGAYTASIPYMLYAWAAVFIVPLYALRTVPIFGPMKKAFARAQLGSVFPEGHSSPSQAAEESLAKSGAHNFILPLAALTIVALRTGDILYGIIVGIIACGIVYLPFKVMKPLDFLACIPEGLKSMATVLITMTGSFILNAVNTEMGLTEYVLNTVTPIISAPLLPLITFLVLAALSFATASAWAMATIAFPIIMPLAAAVDANLFMVAGALISGSAFGVHACFYGDGAILTCAACDIEPFDYGRTSIPLIVVPTVIACVGYLLLGVFAM